MLHVGGCAEMHLNLCSRESVCGKESPHATVCAHVIPTTFHWVVGGVSAVALDSFDDV